MRKITLALLLLAALLLVGQARAASLSGSIEARLPVQGAKVWCPASQSEWDADPNGGKSVLGYTWMTGPDAGDIHLSYETCVALWGADRGDAWAEAVATLYHEWVHSKLHDFNEGDTECLSLYFYRYALRHFWGMSPTDAETAYEYAWAVHVQRGFSYPAYAGWCSEDSPDPLP